MSWEKPLLYATQRSSAFHKRHWDQHYSGLGEGGRFWLDIAEIFSQNWFVARRGEWSIPFPHVSVPGFDMPKYDSSFALSFGEVTDLRAHEIRCLIQKTGAPIAVFYSGGIDSTICLAALIKNLTQEELKKIHVCLSADSILENPSFYEKFIQNKLTVIDSAENRYNNLIEKGYYTITADQGDCIFGTEAATQLYYSHKNLLNRLSHKSKRSLERALNSGTPAELPFRQFADLIQLHFDVSRNPSFGKKFYERVLKNIESSDVPIVSLHDFFWWIIFNLKYMHCALRCVVSYYSGNDRKTALQEKIINWFNHENYQRWSMVNNNNGEKIRGSSPRLYKWAGRSYIYDLDKNDWYFRHKIKLMSLGNIIGRNPDIIDNFTVFGMGSNYEILRITDPLVTQNALESLSDFRI